MGAYKRRALAEAEARCRPIRLGTLAERGVDVFCWCNRCGHNAELETAALILQLGPDMPVPEIGARLRCSGCGGKDVATRPAWPSAGQITRHDGV
ncbi:MAG: hypothetical protein RID91_14435 [Azospirillaceae bacterium]